MDFKAFIKQHKPNLKDISVNNYDRNIRNIYKGIKKRNKKMASLRFLSTDADKVISYINTLENINTKMTYLTICYLCIDILKNIKPSKKLKEIFDLYRSEYLPLKEQYQNRVNSNTPTTKQKNNYIPATELMAFVRTLTDPQKKLVGLLMLKYARRNEWANIEIIDNKDYKKLDNIEKNKFNWLIVKKNKYEFILNQYKTSRHIGQIKLDPDKELTDAIDNHLSTKKEGKYLLYGGRGARITAGKFTDYVKQLFKPLGSNITSTSIRHIILSDMKLEQLKANKAKAKEMGHSVAQQNAYVIDYSKDAIDDV